jgi:hypothetical protein
MKAVLGFIILLVVLILLGPLATIWSLNTLFALKIAYGFFEWLAVVWLFGFFFGVRTLRGN